MAQTTVVGEPGVAGEPGVGGAGSMGAAEFATLGVLLLAMLVSLALLYALRLYRTRLVPLGEIDAEHDDPGARRLAILSRDPLFLLLVASYVTIYIAQVLGAQSGVALLGLDALDPALRDSALITLAAYTGALIGMIFCGVVIPNVGPLLANGVSLKRCAKDLVVGLGWFVLVTPIAFGVAAISAQIATLIEGAPPDAVGHQTLRALVSGDGPWWAWWLTVAGVTIGAPIVEEVLYRGSLQSCARRFLGGWGAIITASVLFALIHVGSADLRTLPGLFVLSLGMGLVYERTGRLLPCVVVHALFNATNVVVVALTLSGNA